MSKRKKTPSDIETEVLTNCARRCCICFGLQWDMSVKQHGQIAHLDHNSSNSTYENLAYLCLPHHAEYDSSSKQSKGMTIAEVKQYRTLLYEAIRQSRNDKLASNRSPGAEEKDSPNEELTKLLSNVHGRIMPLSQCVAETIKLAKVFHNTDLVNFCQNELSGYSLSDAVNIQYRKVEGFISFAWINPIYIGWGGNLTVIFDHLRRNTQNFTPCQFALHQSLSELESFTHRPDFDKSYILITSKWGSINPNADKPDADVFFYSHPLNFQRVLENIRRELNVRLLDLLNK